jgi:hypothetical protein
MCFYTIRMLIDKQQIDITEFHLKTCTYTFCVKMYSDVPNVHIPIYDDTRCPASHGGLQGASYKNN